MFFLATESCVLQQCDMYKSGRYFLPPKPFHSSGLPEGNDCDIKSRSLLISFNEHSQSLSLVQDLQFAFTETSKKSSEFEECVNSLHYFQHEMKPD